MSDATSANSALGRRRWLVLCVIALAQLMVTLDLTVMNIALPSAQHALHFTTADRQWVVTAYTLAFGSLLLLGGRLADLLGRKVTFLTGRLRRDLRRRRPRLTSPCWSPRGPFRARSRRCWCRRHCRS
jgi:hypothetical protein